MTTSELSRRTSGRATVPAHTTQLLPTPPQNAVPFQSLGQQLQAIREVAIREHTGRPYVDPRLVEIQRRAQAAGASEAVPSDGGFLLQAEWSHQIVKRMYDTGALFSRCTVMPITKPNSNALKFPQIDEVSRAMGSRWGGVRGYYENEADAMVASRPRFMASEITANKITALCYLTDELLEDSDAVGNWLYYALSSELLFKLEWAIVNGDGVGKPQGILSSPALITVAAQPGQQSATVNSMNVTGMVSSMWTPSYNSPGTIWLYHETLLPQLASLQTIVGAAGSESKLWQWATAADQFDTLAGFPCVQSEYCQIAGTPGDLLLVDMNRYVIAMRELFRSELSIHVLFLQDTATYRCIIRAGGQTIDKSSVLPLAG